MGSAVGSIMAWRSPSQRATSAATSTHAQRIDEPPYFVYPLRTGITFTYLGAKVDERARMFMADGKRAENVFLAGEIMAGNIQGYVAGFGMTIGTVFGRIARREAGIHAQD